MSKMSEIAIDVEEMLLAGHEPNVVAKVMNIPLAWVLATAEELDNLSPSEDDMPAHEFDDVPF